MPAPGERIRVVRSDMQWLTVGGEPRSVTLSVMKDMASGDARLYLFVGDVDAEGHPIPTGVLHVPAGEIEALVDFLRHGSEATP